MLINRNYSRVGLRAAGLALVAFCFAIPSAWADVTELWAARFNNVVTNTQDWPAKVVIDVRGDIIVTGNTGPDMVTIKFSQADGSIVWQRRYLGPPGFGVTPRGLAVDSNGNVALTAAVAVGPHGMIEFQADLDYYTAKYSSIDGSLLWEQSYNGPGNYYDNPAAITVDLAGNVIVTGTSQNIQPSESYNFALDYYTAKYAAADGALLWERRYSCFGAGINEAFALAVDRRGDVIVTGYSQNDSASSDMDFYTAKYASATGALLWEKRHNGPGDFSDFAYAMALDQDGNAYVTGTSYSTLTGNDLYVVKYASVDGVEQWEQRYNGVANREERPDAIAVDSSGNVVVTGWSENGPPRYGRDQFVAKYAARDGALLWGRRSPVEGASPPAVAVDTSGNVILIGSSPGFHTAKYAAADGSLIWERLRGGPTATNDLGRALAIDAGGDVVVTGYSLNATHFDYCTVRYAAGTGRVIWEKHYDGSVKFAASGKAVAVDADGNVLTTGEAVNDAEGLRQSYTTKHTAQGTLLWARQSPGKAGDVAADRNGNVLITGSVIGIDGWDYDYRTAKYAPDGTLLWESFYGSPLWNHDEARALAIDADGNVAITGTTDGDYYTAKYAATDGSLLWSKTYRGADGLNDQPVAVSIDGQGSVIVTGSVETSQNSGHRYTRDYYTAKYAAVDGRLLWERRYNGPANSDDEARALAVDATGNIIVTGASAAREPIEGSFIYDYYTAKYAAADGALIWEKRFPGGSAFAVAVDADGNVVVTGDSATLKYAAADGSVLWTTTYVEGFRNAVVIDRSGDIVVKGVSNNSGDSFYTAKYRSADGILIWEKHYHEANSFWHSGSGSHSLALGPNGIVAITGSSYLGPYNASDLTVVVYRETLPAIAIRTDSAGLRLRFPAIPGRSYAIERTADVNGPWTVIATAAASDDSQIQFVDLSPLPGAGFYRTREP